MPSEYSYISTAGLADQRTQQPPDRSTNASTNQRVYHLKDRPTNGSTIQRTHQPISKPTHLAFRPGTNFPLKLLVVVCLVRTPFSSDGFLVELLAPLVDCSQCFIIVGSYQKESQGEERWEREIYNIWDLILWVHFYSRTEQLIPGLIGTLSTHDIPCQKYPHNTSKKTPQEQTYSALSMPVSGTTTVRTRQEY